MLWTVFQMYALQIAAELSITLIFIIFFFITASRFPWQCHEICHYRQF
jgi:hypothetical protein